MTPTVVAVYTDVWLGSDSIPIGQDWLLFGAAEHRGDSRIINVLLEQRPMHYKGLAYDAQGRSAETECAGTVWKLKNWQRRA